MIPVTNSQKSISKETYYSVKRDLLQRQKRPTTASKDAAHLTHVRKRDLLQCQKRPTKETYSVKRDILQCQKRPTTVSKETYQRDLQCQKRPTLRTWHKFSNVSALVCSLYKSHYIEYVQREREEREREREREGERERERERVLCRILIH